MSTVTTTTAAASGSNAIDADRASLRKSAEQFEALFLTKIVEQMNVSAGGGGSGASAGLYRHMMDQSLAQHLAHQGGIGVADFLYAQWSGERTPTQAASSLPMGGTMPVVPPMEQGVPLPPGTIDDGSRPLRELLPPTGLEGGPATISLNRPAHRTDAPSGAPAPLGGSEHGRHSQDTPASPAAGAVAAHSDSATGRGERTGRHRAAAIYRGLEGARGRSVEGAGEGRAT